MKDPDKIKLAFNNAKKALSRLELFLAKPIEDDRDQAGIIQAFEFTYEIFWKTFQKIATSQGLSAQTPKEALKAAFQMNLIDANEELTWLDMMKDRNLTSHTYKEELSQEIFERIRDRYFSLFKLSFKRIELKNFS